MNLYADADDFKKMTDQELRLEWAFWRNEQLPQTMVDDVFICFARGAIRGEMERRGLSTSCQPTKEIIVNQKGE